MCSAISVVIIVVMLSSTAAKELLRGKSFLESLGHPRFICAPMVDQSELQFRLLTRKNGADLAFTPMINSKNFMADKKYRYNCCDWVNYQHSSRNKDIENEHKDLDKNTIVQFCGDDPDALVAAGKYIHDSVAAIDLNLGCPQKIAKRGNYGAYLLPNGELVIKLLSAMVNNLNCPITAKIRVLEDVESTLRLCREIEKCGVSMLTVHGRTVDSSKQFTGPVDWDVIRKIKQAVTIPVVANGGIACLDDARRCLEETGADAVMSAEALLENPKMFSEEGDLFFRTNFVRSQLNTVNEYIDLVISTNALNLHLDHSVRSHVFKMLHRILCAKSNADVRDMLAGGDFKAMRNAINILHERLSTVDFDTDLALERGLIGPTNWYYRHRDEKAAQRVMCPRRRQQLIVPVAESVLSIAEKSAILKARLLNAEKVGI